MLSSRPGAFLFLLSVTVTAGVADDLPPEVIRLAHFKQKVRQDLAQVPNYTCLETMERFRRGPRAHSFMPVDTVRLEVSNVNGKELLAWPGARRFEDKNLTSFVSSGMIGNGMFALHAHNLFVNDTTAFVYRGEDDLDGRDAVRYDYNTPQFMSGYRLRINGAEATVAMKGSFWFDPVSLDLLRLDVYGDEIPVELGLESSIVVTYYSREHIGKSPALLPRKAELELIFFSGEGSRNLIAFSACHEYGSESTISFDPPPAPVAQIKPQVAERDLAGGLLIPLRLESAIDSKSVSVGDAVYARVREDVLQNGELVLPAGARVSGRIRSVEHYPAPGSHFLLGIEFSEAEWQHEHAQFQGELLDRSGHKMERSRNNPSVSVLYIAGSSFHLAPGFRMLWRTLSEQPASGFR